MFNYFVISRRMNTPVSTYYPIKTLFSASFTFSTKEKDSEIGYSVTSLRSANAKRVWLGIRSFVGLVQGITAAI